MNAQLQQPVISGGGRPKKYLLADGKTRVPGTTTITGRFKDAGGLIQWAWKQGIEGNDINRIRDDAGDSGNLAHGMIDCWLLGKEQPAREARFTDEQWAHALNAFEQFKRWVTATRITITHSEMPLISEAHRFGGTLDAVGVLDGALCLLDWKSSGGIYADYIVQLGGYSILWHEVHGERFAECHLARFDKGAAVTSHHSFGRPVLDVAEQQFLRLRDAYEADKDLKKWAK